ncbi:hypothetical protein VP01_5663g1 [Puccinia sorghi]|uniref:Uncharacterized protein n=1 Tax=Puccinia sorghi TaxID=27349 RepID=A0A0L6UIU3_9BASI|nr:hypothetical protein VP01_5663g1 [Puccinia sorghi]
MSGKELRKISRKINCKRCWSYISHHSVIEPVININKKFHSVVIFHKKKIPFLCELKYICQRDCLILHWLACPTQLGCDVMLMLCQHYIAIGHPPHPCCQPLSTPTATLYWRRLIQCHSTLTESQAWLMWHRPVSTLPQMCLTQPRVGVDTSRLIHSPNELIHRCVWSHFKLDMDKNKVECLAPNRKKRSNPRGIFLACSSTSSTNSMKQENQLLLPNLMKQQQFKHHVSCFLALFPIHGGLILFLICFYYYGNHLRKAKPSFHYILSFSTLKPHTWSLAGTENSIYNEAHLFYCQFLDITQHAGFKIMSHGITPGWKILDLLIGILLWSRLRV